MDLGIRDILDLRDFLQEILPSGFGIYEAYIRPAGKGWHFEIILDGLKHRSGAVSVDDCAEFSRNFSEKLDSELLAENPFALWPGIFPEGLTAENYSVQVSSAGAERILRIPEDLERFRGLPLRLKFRSEGTVYTALAVFEKEADSYYCFREYVPRKGSKKKKLTEGLLSISGCEAAVLKENLIQANLYLDL